VGVLPIVESVREEGVVQKGGGGGHEQQQPHALQLGVTALPTNKQKHCGESLNTQERRQQITQRCDLLSLLLATHLTKDLGLKAFIHIQKGHVEANTHRQTCNTPEEDILSRPCLAVEGSIGDTASPSARSIPHQERVG